MTLPAYQGDPVVIVGNGPVGQTTALLLARWGIPVEVLDSRPAREMIGSKSICQARDVLDVWAAVGARRIAEEGVTWTTARTFYRDQELFSWTLPVSGRSPWPACVNISQTRTEQILDEAIAAQPLIRVRWSHEVTDFDSDDTGVTITCTTPQGQRTLRAPYAVACAGGHAHQVRQALGVRFAGHSFDDRFLICDIRTQLPGWETERRFYFDPQWNPDRQVLIHPCPGSTYRIDWQVPPDFDLSAEQADGRLDQRIRNIVGDADYEIVWMSVYRFHSRHADRFRSGRVLLAGDCAHLVAPFGARGLNSGVQDAENAAWKLAFVLHGWASSALLDSYHAERNAAALENIEITSRTMDFLVPQTESGWQRRRAALDRAAGDPSHTGEIDSGRFTEPFWYSDSPLTTPDPAHPATGRPPRGQAPPPAPGVLVPDAPVLISGKLRYLRSVARSGLFVLTQGYASTDLIVSCLENAGHGAPVFAHRLEGIDQENVLRGEFGARDGEIWLLRPDAHIAAVAHNVRELDAAARRMLGF